MQRPGITNLPALFTTVLAGLAFTITTLPKTSLLPALVAGFKRVFTMQRPGITNLPALFTSLAATPARLLMTFMHSDLFSSVSSANARARPPFVIGFAAAFITFMGAMVKKAGGWQELSGWEVVL